MNAAGFDNAVAALLAKAGLSVTHPPEQLVGGANNRVFRIRADGKSVLLKAYFQHPDDKRDRLAAEFSFATFAWQHGVRCLPQPLTCDPKNHLGLFEFVEGRRLLTTDVDQDAVKQALDFFTKLNRYKDKPAAKALPIASEACFSLAGHLACVERRLQNLRGVEDPTAASFVRDDLLPRWHTIVGAARAKAAVLGLPLETEIAASDRCLSPSDFGFHNALLEPTGRLRFLDFEYAGWDDPAKTVCDFFCQPSLSVNAEFYPAVVHAITSGLSQPEAHARRMDLLLPVYRMKWCCILLNDFLPVGGQRRRFAHSEADQKTRQAQQLDYARRALKEIRS